MSRLSPKPIIAQVYQTWTVPPGMKIALVEDMERNVWIVESCPVGTHFWTLAQARELCQTGRTGHAMREAIAAGVALNTVPTPHAAPGRCRRQKPKRAVSARLPPSVSEPCALCARRRARVRRLSALNGA